MTDRELLEAVAKAAEIEIVGVASRHIVQGVGEDDLLVVNDRGGNSVWNPLTDDGDALRLAVKLGICFGPNFDGDKAVCFGPNGNNIVEPMQPDPYAATRRAIVLAAAKMGEPG